MKVLEVDSKTGVPLNPEDILSEGKGSGKVGGVSKIFLIGGILVTFIFPIIGALIGYTRYGRIWDGIGVGIIIFISNYLTIRVVAWMTKEQNK